VSFEWDAGKAKINERKHGVSFELAVEVFQDAERIERPNMESSLDEERWAVTGLVDGIELYVVYVMRGEVTRLITARRASRDEREKYWDREI
jgi:hypothetical protein